MIFGFSGRKQSGKDTCANIMRDELMKLGYIDEVVLLSFAEPIKSHLSTMFDIDISYFNDPMLKEKTLETFPFQSPRQLMTWYGSILKEKFGNDIWINLALKKIDFANQNIVYIFTDVRFIQEAEFIKKMNGVILYVDRDNVLPPLSLDSHISEKSVYDVRDNVVCRRVDNNYDMSNLKLQVPFLTGILSHKYLQNHVFPN